MPWTFSIQVVPQTATLNDSDTNRFVFNDNHMSAVMTIEDIANHQAGHVANSDSKCSLG